MDRFTPALRRVARELDLPAAERAATPREMEADRGAIHERDHNPGASEEAAAARAERRVLGSSEMLRRLSDVHRRSWGWSERTAARLARGVDLWLVLIGVLPVLLVATGVAAPAVLSPRTPGSWLLVALAALLIATIVAEAWRVGGRGEVPRSLSTIVVLSALAPACGVLTMALGVFRAGTERSSQPTTGDQMLLAQTVAEYGPAVVLGLLLGIAGAFSWFLLLHLSAARRLRQVDALLRGHGPGEAPAGAEGVLPLVRGRSA
jgi:hypothetical protein